MKQRVVLLTAALMMAAVASCKHDASQSGGSGSASAGSASASGSAAAAGSDPWASTGANSNGGSGASGASGANGSSAGKPAAGSATPAPVTAKLTRPFLFHATKDGAHDVWLFGTIHLGVDPQAVPDVVLGKLDAAPSFAMEADINDPSLLKAIIRSDGKTLEDELGAELWKKFVAAVGESMANNFQNLKTSAAATVLDVQGMPMTTPIDLFLLQRAKKANKTVVFLEPASKQLAILDKWMDRRALEEMLDEVGEQKKKNLELIDAYVAGDEAKAIAMSKDEEADFLKSGRTHAEFEAMMKDLLLDRNASWIPEIQDMAKKGDAFVAVGAMHLLGPGSVPELLAKAGWKIERVTP
jgi:uncharacterized protein